MPKQTFFNLSPDKRGTIEQAALDEFTAYGFDNSNMNRIVAQSRIAKGSFYQYFEDKKAGSRKGVSISISRIKKIYTFISSIPSPPGR